MGVMAGVRERARIETTARIVELARQQVEREGAASLSLRAVARELGMVSSAVYRYFASRDELLTRLIIDSYDRLGTAVEQADSAVRRSDFRRRWKAITTALRQWALDHPAEYALLFGTPVPGYAAPSDTVGPASRYTAVLLRLLVDVEASGHRPVQRVPVALRRDFAALRLQLPTPHNDALLMRGITAWVNVMGSISFELFGHFRNVFESPGAFFDAVVAMHGELIFAET
jgi:AcrR family transcriptional regulator